jgi:hypothetical protein
MRTKMKKDCEQKLKKLTNKKEIFFTNRGNTSILLALKLAKSLGKTKAFIQDQGGWITYDQYLKKLKFDFDYLESDYGLLTLTTIKKHVDSDSVLLINSMAGYIAQHENIDRISEICKEKGCLLVNDVSASIGTKYAKYGDIIIGSFGRWKPINNEYGGFISYNEIEYTNFFNDNFDKELKPFYSELNEKLNGLDKRLKEYQKIRKKILTQLSQYDVIHRNNEGINVVVKFNSEKEKLDIVNYCKLYNYEFTLCPRYIRVMDDAVSIEIKRI